MKINVTIGAKCGQWTVLSYSHKNDHYQFFWHCRCTCGYESILEQSRLANGLTTCCKVCANAKRRKYPPLKIGAIYGKWLVLQEDPKCKYYVFAQCACKKIRRVDKQSLIYGGTKQCHSCAGKTIALRHGHSCKGHTSSEYRAWLNAKNRILNPKTSNYHRYGGRGIKMCSRWINSFENFLQDLGPKPSPKHSLERIDNDGDYEPDNVRWALPIEQNHNRSTTNKINGQHINLKELAKELNIHPRTIKNLLNKATFSIDEVKAFSKMSHYQKIQMGKSINNNMPLTYAELTKVISPVLPSPKRHPLWCTWHSMKQRCNNPNNKDYENYGARGITVCDDWQTFESFLKSILITIGNKPSPAHQLDRIDNNKDYEANNVRWASKQEQARNKSNTIYLKGFGISAQELALRYRISHGAVIKLAKLGWDADGLQFYAKLSFKEKKYLKIFAGKLSQRAAINAYETLRMKS